MIKGMRIIYGIGINGRGIDDINDKINGKIVYDIRRSKYKYYKKDFKCEEYIDCMKIFPAFITPKSLFLMYKSGYIDEKEFEQQFITILEEWEDVINRDEVLSKLNGVVLLCYEKPDEFCHRKVIAKFLERFGFIYEEL